MGTDFGTIKTTTKFVTLKFFYKAQSWSEPSVHSIFILYTISAIIRQMGTKGKNIFRLAHEILHRASWLGHSSSCLFAPMEGYTPHHTSTMHISIIVRGVSLKPSHLTCVKCPGLSDIALLCCIIKL